MSNKRKAVPSDVREKKPKISGFAFEWLNGHRNTHLVEMSNTHSAYPMKVIFHPASSSWNLKDTVDQFCSEESFKQTVASHCKTFDMSSVWAPATEFKTLVTEASYKCETLLGAYKSTSDVVTKPEASASGGDMVRLLGLLNNCLQNKSSNGPAKLFFHTLINKMLQDLSATERFCVENPVNTSLCISRYSLIDEYVPESPESPASSLLDADVEHFIVPDVIIYDIFKPCFALNIEIKQPSDVEVNALVQCFTQMLTQMHNQDVQFGLVVSSMEWTLIIAIKLQTGVIAIRQFNRSMYLVASPGSDDAKPIHLDVDSLISLINWIYQILTWNTRNK